MNNSEIGLIAHMIYKKFDEDQDLKQKKTKNIVLCDEMSNSEIGLTIENQFVI
jgi:hypothetical protein